jgi:hypothetical protein
MGTIQNYFSFLLSRRAAGRLSEKIFKNLLVLRFLDSISKDLNLFRFEARFCKDLCSSTLLFQNQVFAMNGLVVLRIQAKLSYFLNRLMGNADFVLVLSLLAGDVSFLNEEFERIYEAGV